ncbi:MAG TPA: carbohydrate porin [Methylomirabilota bacterium]|nr:carbohydrate porin [Methylomirabilota bacterium]
MIRPQQLFHWLGLVCLSVAIQFILAEAAPSVEVRDGPLQTQAPGFEQLHTQAPPAESPEEDSFTRLPGWLADILALTPEPQSSRLPAWLPRVLGAQATIVDQGVLPFHSPYRDANSFKANGDNQISQTYGLYLGSQLTTRLQLYFDVEMFKGEGISNGTGLGGLTDGDVIRSGSVQLAKNPYVARAYFRYVLPLSPEIERAERAMGQMPGPEPVRRLEVKVGKFATNDDFDQNRYANSTRTQFLNWSLWNNTAWDFAADTRGFSYGVLLAWVSPTWTVRVGSLMMPTRANGNSLDEHIWNARGDNVELTLRPTGWGTVIRFLGYINQARMGIYRDAIAKAQQTGATPDITKDDHPGRIKWGGGINIEQPLADHGETGVFARLGCNDGKTETFTFTEVDRLASVGLQLSGVHWGRSQDVLGMAYAFDGLAPEHRRYLEQGGAGFVLGDGKLNYALEQILEVYYRVQLWRYVQTSLDYQFIQNPGYNRDRGPAHVIGGRLRVSF